MDRSWLSLVFLVSLPLSLVASADAPRTELQVPVIHIAQVQRPPDIGVPGNVPGPRARPEHVLQGRVWLQASGLALDSSDPRAQGCSLVGDGQVRFASPGFSAQIRKGPLAIHGYVPGSRDEYEYFLVVRPLGESYPGCNNAAHTPRPENFVAAVAGVADIDRPDVEGDGHITPRLSRATSTRVLGSGVQVPQHPRRVLSYYIRVYVVGSAPPGSSRTGLQAVCSNVVTVAIAPQGSRCL